MPTDGRRSRARRAPSVGRNTRRIDAERKVTGRAVYDSDIDRDGLLHAAIHYTTRPHAEVRRIDTGAAEAIDGVVCVLPRAELLGRFDGRVRHYGDVVAAVAAEDRATADRAARAIDCELDPLEAVFDPHEAVGPAAPVVHENNVDYGQHGQHPFTVENDRYVHNIDDYHRTSIGDVETGFEAADHVVEGTYTTPRVEHCNLNTHCTIAEWVDGTLTLTETLPSHGRSQREIAGFLEIDPERVRIHEPPTASSSFGGRSLRKPAVEPVAASLAKATGRPVKLWLDRELEFVSTANRHPTTITLKTGVTDDGSLTALAVDVIADTGAYPNGVGHVVLANSADRPLDLYRVDHYRYEGVSVFTNNVPGGEYRAIGSTQVVFALETHLDEVAAAAGIDRVQLRRQNFVEEGDPRPYDPKATAHSAGLIECLERGHTRFASMRREEPPPPGRRRGWGLAAGAHPTTSGALEEDTSEAILVLRADGSITAHTGAVDQGQGVDTVIAQIVSHEVGIPADRIVVEPFATTDRFADHLGSIASRSTYIIGAAVREAAVRLERELRERAAAKLDADAGDVTIEDGVAVGRDGEVAIEGLLSAADDGALEVMGAATTRGTPVSYGVHFAEVEVDVATGAVALTAFLAAQDVGYAINPRMVEGQLEGALLHGCEFALYSSLRLEAGLPRNANLAEYPVLSPIEMPERIECVIVESNEESGPYGAKGLGTPSMPPVAPAIVNALANATGERFRDPPVDAEDVCARLNPAAMDR